MFCPKCGKENDDNAAFCSSCGAKLNAPQAAEAVKKAPVVTATATGSVTTGDGTTVKAAKRTSAIIGIIVAVVIVAAIVVAVMTTGGFGFMGPGVGVKGSVNDYSWDELSKISAEISKSSNESDAIETAKKFNLTTADGKLDGTQVKDFQLKDGAAAQVQIAGFWHDDKADGGKAGITFIFKDAVAVHSMNLSNSNSGGWEDSQMRTWCSSEGLNMLPDDLKNALVEVDKKTNNVGETESVGSMSMTVDGLWLYSEKELFGDISWGDSDFVDVLNEEGIQYKLYKDMEVSSGWSQNDALVKWFNGADCYWWTRSPHPNTSDKYCAVSGGGGLYPIEASDSRGVVPGFCI